MLASQIGIVPAPAVRKVITYSVNVVVVGHRDGKANWWRSSTQTRWQGP